MTEETVSDVPLLLNGRNQSISSFEMSSILGFCLHSLGQLQLSGCNSFLTCGVLRHLFYPYYGPNIGCLGYSGVYCILAERGNVDYSLCAACHHSAGCFNSVMQQLVYHQHDWQQLVL